MAKARVAHLLESDNYHNVATDDDLVDKKGKLKPKFANERISEFITRDYYPDVYAEQVTESYWSSPPIPITQPVIIEVDHNHRSDRQTKKDKVRDKHFLSKGIPTIRFNLENLIGKKKWSDFALGALIRDEIHYQKKKEVA